MTSNCLSSVQLLSWLWLFVTPGTAAHQASLSISNCWSLLKLMPMESVMPSNHLSLCRPHSPSTFNLSQHQGLFQGVSSLHQVAKVLEFQFQHQSFQWTFRVDFLQDWLFWSPCFSRDSQESSPEPRLLLHSAPSTVWACSCWWNRFSGSSWWPVFWTHQCNISSADIKTWTNLTCMEQTQRQPKQE